MYNMPVQFDGDIIITDPCYVVKELDTSTMPKWEDYMRLSDYSGMSDKELGEAGFFEDLERLHKAEDEWKKNHQDDWDVCGCGSDMGRLGFTTYLCDDTIWGDWSCNTYNTDTKEKIGEFCADAGMVAVFLLDEVLKYNPDFDYHTNRTWTTTWIKDFHGTIELQVEDGEVLVVGKGNINFTSKQVG